MTEIESTMSQDLVNLEVNHARTLGALKRAEEKLRKMSVVERQDLQAIYEVVINPDLTVERKVEMVAKIVEVFARREHGN